MRLLLLDTCGAEGSVALADTALDEPVVAVERMPGRTASERLVAVLRGAMEEEGWALRELAAIAVVSGPGSFTGVRVGLSVAKGLSEASGVPMIAISRLAVLAALASDAGRVCALLDAGRGEFYCGEYVDAVAVREALVSREEAIAAGLDADAIVVCEDGVAQVLRGAVAFTMTEEPTAADALPLVLKRLADGSFEDPMTLDALYLRRTDAEIFAPKVAPKSLAKTGPKTALRPDARGKV